MRDGLQMPMCLFNPANTEGTAALLLKCHRNTGLHSWSRHMWSSCQHPLPSVATCSRSLPVLWFKRNVKHVGMPGEKPATQLLKGKENDMQQRLKEMSLFSQRWVIATGPMTLDQRSPDIWKESATFMSNEIKANELSFWHGRLSLETKGETNTYLTPTILGVGPGTAVF